MVRSDDNSSFISITPNFTFFGYKQLWVNVNGAITFPTSVSTFTPSCSSLNGTYSIAALFWADVDITMSGHIYYRQSTESELLSKANNEITNAFPYLTNIDINWLFIATWHNVTYYPDNLPDPYYRKRNTFQAILAISGAQSFIIFYYNNITWTTGDASGGNNGLG
uniref:NIDO domain-containing protein n=1 Tax=Acrobeloides nanus TaxID=290746 RepID=A0A914E0N5_9BILA